jgi:acyl transferase domain-containing protein
MPGICLGFPNSQLTFDRDQQIPGRINYCFKFTGPSYSVDTACSSSLSALHIACNALWRGDVDTAIVGGTNVLTNPDMTSGLDKGHFLSPTGNCKTFDATADGYCRGEGVASVIIKRLEDAIEDDDPIQGIIGGAFTNHSAEAESITRPHVGAQKDIFERVLNDSGTDPYDVGYIEMHGTGTQAGDSREMQSVLGIFAPDGAAQNRTAQQKLHLGALKSNIGHGESVSGVSALIKVITMMQKHMIPPHCGIKTVINPRFPTDLADRNVHIALEPTSWEHNGTSPRKAFINNFSAAGGNSSVLVEEAPRLPQQVAAESNAGRAYFPIAISARCPASLEGNLRAIHSYLAEKEGQSSAQLLSQLSYTTTARRMHHPFRVMFSASCIADAKAMIFDSITRVSSRVVPPKAMLFAFTGQGSQYPGMGKQLYETLSVFRDRLNHFDRLSSRLGFPSIVPLFTASHGANITDYEPVVVQLANVCMQIALASIWISWGVSPTATVGHSLGEYAALNIAGVLSDIDTVYLVGHRAKLLQAKCDKGTHSMVAAFASESRIRDVARGLDFETACINGETETVLSGTLRQMAQLQQSLTSSGIRNTLLKVPYAFHSSQIDPVLADFKAKGRSCVFHQPRIPVLSPLLGQVVTESGVFGPDYIARHAREPVHMLAAVRAGSNADLVGESTLGIEFGPHPVVSEMIQGALGPKVRMLSTLRRNRDVWETLTQTLSALYSTGLQIKWDEYFRDLPSARTVLHLPAYSWDLKSYWIKYRNDWTLTKGDIAPEAQLPLQLPPPAQVAKTDSPGAMITPTEEIPVLESTTVHKIVEEESEDCRFLMTVETNVSRPDLNPIMQGHRVEDIGLCTPVCGGAPCPDVSLLILFSLSTATWLSPSEHTYSRGSRTSSLVELLMWQTCRYRKPSSLQEKRLSS